MEISNSAVLRAHSSYYSSGSGFDTRHHRLAFSWGNREFTRDLSRFGRLKSSARMVSADPCGVGGGFKEKGHLEYYEKSIAPVCAEKKKEKKAVDRKDWSMISMKKRSKLLKGLEENLSMFSELGFGLNPDQTKGEIVSQAAEVLLQQLEHLRSEEKKAKSSRVREMERPKSPRMKMIMEDSESESESSSSSSSESSDSECEGQRANMSNLQTTTMATSQQQLLVVEGERTEASHQDSGATSMEGTTFIVPSSSQSQINYLLGVARALETDRVGTSTTSGGSFVTVSNEANSMPAVAIEQSSKRIQVCMGGKCKKSGAQVLADEFSRVLGVEEGGSVAVTTCKCMGKCKTAPNVKVLAGEEEMMGGDDSIRTPMNALCLGVGLADVELIVANYFRNEAMSGACASSPAPALLPSS